jgi:type IV fimbrial biogenesis protein FimT
MYTSTCFLSARAVPAVTRRARGFTLIELMTVITVVAIFASIAAPSFKRLIATQRVRTAASALKESLWMARAEATRRNANVGFVFVNAATDWIVPDPAFPADPTKALLKQQGFPSVASVTQSGDNVQFSFNAYGRLSSGSGWIQIGDTQAGVYQCIAVATTGRATTTNGACPS